LWFLNLSRVECFVRSLATETEKTLHSRATAQVVFIPMFAILRIAVVLGSLARNFDAESSRNVARAV